MNKSYCKLILTLIILSGVIFFYVFPHQKAAEAIITPSKDKTESIQITGKITDQKAAKAGLTLLQQNLQAANAKDSTAYADTLIKKAQAATKKEMDKFFASYDLHHELLSFEVIKQEQNQMVIKAEQKTINQGKEKYRNHISEARHLFVKEDGSWKIKETNMADTNFID